ncbi:MAG: lamin tail domain-containing protein [Patescibacteria group bacterium]
MQKIVFAAAFLGIISLIGGGIYFSFIKNENSKNFLEDIGQSFSNDFKFVGKIELGEKQNFKNFAGEPVKKSIKKSGKVIISEIMTGADKSANYEFIELYNSTPDIIDLTDWSIKKKNSSGSESTLISSSRFENKIIFPNKYFLLANEGGYSGDIKADIFWPKSYTLSNKNNSVIFYNSNEEGVEEISWIEIPKNQSIEREPLSGNQFKFQLNPNPQNSQGN